MSIKIQGTKLIEPTGGVEKIAFFYYNTYFSVIDKISRWKNIDVHSTVIQVNLINIYKPPKPH